MKKFVFFLTIFSVILLAFPQAALAGEGGNDPNEAHLQQGVAQGGAEAAEVGAQAGVEADAPGIQYGIEAEAVEPAAATPVGSEDPYEALLRAGKPRPGVNDIVGGVQVWNDADTLYILFVADAPYCISALHLQVANDLSSVPDADGDPDNGRPAINETYDDCLTERGPFTYDISENGWYAGSNLVIAAHADIGIITCTTECELITAAPYGAAEVVDAEQGLRANGTPVLASRSNPDTVLSWDYTKLEFDFFSLGTGGWVEVEFGCPIVNGEGDDILIIEDTWADPYHLETAEVYASQDGVEWVLLGEATNLVRDTEFVWQTISTFDLGELDEASFIKIVDTTLESTPVLPWDADGFDLNTIQSLQDCEECTEVCVTCAYGRAWAGNMIEPGQLWSRWFRYIIQ